MRFVIFDKYELTKVNELLWGELIPIQKVIEPLFFYMVGGLIILNLIIGVIVNELQEGKILLERKMMRESFSDDVSEHVKNSMSELENQILNINTVFKKLQVSLDKNQSGD